MSDSTAERPRSDGVVELAPGAVDSAAAIGTTGASVISGGLWNTLSQSLPQGFALIISVAAARFLGPDGMGRQSFIAFTMISITQVISEGLKESLMRSVGELLGADRTGEVRGLVRWAAPTLLLGGLAGCVVLIVAAQLGASPAAAWVLAGVECLLVTVQGAPWAALAGSQKWRQASTVGLLTTAVGVPVTVGVLALGGGIVGMFAVETATAGVALVAIAILALRALRALPRHVHPAREMRQRTTRYAVLATLMTLATFVVWQRSEFFFLRAYSTDRQIAFYSIAFAAASGLALLPGALAGTLSPAFATLYGARHHGRIRSGYWRAQRLLPILSLPLLAGFAALGPALIRLVYGSSYSAAGPLLLILLTLFPLIPLLGVANSLLVGLGVLRVALIWELVGAAATIGLNFLLVPTHAAVGAAIADVGGQLVVVIPVLVYAGMQVAPAAIDARAIARAALASAPAGAAAWIVDVSLGGVAGLVGGALAGLVVFAPLATLLRVIPARDRDWLRDIVQLRYGERAGRLAETLVSDPGIARRAAAGGGERERLDSGMGGALAAAGPPCRRLVVYSDALQRGGAERALGYLIGALDERIEVAVVGVEPGIVAWIASQRPGAAEVVVPAVRHKWQLRPILAHLRAIRALRPEVLHASLSTPWSCQYGILAGLACPGTGVVAVENAPTSSSQALQRWIKRVISRRLAVHVAVGECSARETERAIGLAEGSLVTIRNGVPDLPRTASRRHATEPVIGTVSRVSEQKGIDLLVHALPALPSATAVIVGDGPALAQMRDLAERLGVAGRLQTPGFDPNPRQRLEEFDIFVLPTHKEAALPLAVVEAMLMELPVVTTCIECVSETFIPGETGLLVAPGDLDSLVGALRSLVDDGALRERMGTRARAFALERFGMAAMVRSYEGLYREIANFRAATAERRRW
ncbi:MAG TPA: glycosyltransferase [Solirubrobacteraceae bacterium]|jgi:glycosyltransferase involved in cell wall biosynthesis/O-antigen/teichoic acid export membrane protein|nr:glycosyltransferase [Solirubrobacteraceae bacterium]